MQIKLSTLVSASIVAAALAMPVHAGDTSASFKALDTNADGRISQDEAKASKGVSENYGALDINKDGTLDAAEFSAFETGGGSAPPKPMK